MDITTKARLVIIHRDEITMTKNGQPRLRGTIAIPSATKGEADQLANFTAFGKANVDNILALAPGNYGAVKLGVQALPDGSQRLAKNGSAEYTLRYFKHIPRTAAATAEAPAA